MAIFEGAAVEDFKSTFSSTCKTALILIETCEQDMIVTIVIGSNLIHNLFITLFFFNTLHFLLFNIFNQLIKTKNQYI